ncbi:MAG: DNA translocase FtsK [Anaerolineaceae bacterium]|nr:DNA translocase FtsK [Anaerolineaceae bacterium]
MNRPPNDSDTSGPEIPIHDLHDELDETEYSDADGLTFDSLPPWGAEIVALVLVVFGIISLLSLFNVSPDATVAQAWANALSSVFGYGSLLVAPGIIALGLVLLVPRWGIMPKLPPRRILALQIAFLALLAMLHVTSGGSEWRAIARAGQGGGIVGWGLSVVVAGLFGSAFAFFFYLVIFAACIAAMFGHDLSWFVQALQRASTLFRRGGKNLATGPQGPRTRQNTPTVPRRPPVTDDQQKLNIVRIRPNPAHIPPSRRATRPPAFGPDDLSPADKARTEAPPRPRPGVLPLPHDRPASRPRRQRSEIRLVERPDGRMRRFFSFDHEPEARVHVARGQQLPPLELLADLKLDAPDAEEINRNIVLLENTLLEFDIDIEVVDVQVGPTITRYAIQPYRENPDDREGAVFSRTRVRKIVSLTNDLALALAARRLRLETPVPGKNYLGLEVPNLQPAIVALRPVLESETYNNQRSGSGSPLVIPLGRDVAGLPVAADIGQMPHLLIAGATGTGKSVAIASIATSLLLQNTPDTLRMVMLDPKLVELSRFNGIPHLVGPVETRPERIIEVLRWCTREMDRRYRLLESANARNIEAYNARPAQRQDGTHLPWIVIIVDEIGDLMQAHPEETERALTRLAQMARAVGMHLIVATQRPSVDVLTGLIKANFPTRMAFAVASGVDSRVILDSVGAESLLGNGDMLYLATDASGPQRIQGCLVSEEEVRAVVDYWRRQAQFNVRREPAVRSEAPWEQAMRRRQLLSDTDPMLEQAVRAVLEEGEASASLLQRRMGLGYPRAARIIDLLFELQIIGPPEAGGRGRRVLYEPGQDPLGEAIQRRKQN